MNQSLSSSNPLLESFYKKIYYVALATLILPAIGTFGAVGYGLVFGLSSLDLWFIAIGYLITIAGVEIGFHRHFSHQAFKARWGVRYLLGAIALSAWQGTIAYWVSTHKKHHRFSDTERDPHTPYINQDEKAKVNVSSFFRAHYGWMLKEFVNATEREDRKLLADPVIRQMDRYYLLFMILGILLPGLIYMAFLPTLDGFLRGALYGGFVRIFASQNMTWAINSFCHVIGSRMFNTIDSSRNSYILMIPTLGGSLHNNHHAFPRTASNSFSKTQIDICGWIIYLLKALGLCWDVYRPNERQIANKKLDCRECN